MQQIPVKFFPPPFLGISMAAFMWNASWNMHCISQKIRRWECKDDKCEESEMDMNELNWMIKCECADFFALRCCLSYYVLTLFCLLDDVEEWIFFTREKEGGISIFLVKNEKNNGGSSVSIWTKQLSKLKKSCK